jgi:hypothetical protein
MTVVYYFNSHPGSPKQLNRLLFFQLIPSSELRNHRLHHKMGLLFSGPLLKA